MKKTETRRYYTDKMNGFILKATIIENEETTDCYVDIEVTTPQYVFKAKFRNPTEISDYNYLLQQIQKEYEKVYNEYLAPKPEPGTVIKVDNGDVLF